MGYRIDPDKDRVHIEEFRRAPIGHHSPGLQRVLNTLRFDATGRQVILVCRRPFAEWVLGEMPADRSRAVASGNRARLHEPGRGRMGGIPAPLAGAHGREHQPALALGEVSGC